MKLVLLLLLITGAMGSKLQLNNCPTVSVNQMNFYACEVEPYSKVYFHDPTGENQITIVPNRLYRNHGYYVAYSSSDKLFVADKKHSKQIWFDNYDSITNL